MRSELSKKPRKRKFGRLLNVPRNIIRASLMLKSKKSEALLL